MTTEELLKKAKFLCIMAPDQVIDEKRAVFAGTHDTLIMRTRDQYRNWTFPMSGNVLPGKNLNEHHLTTNFLFNTLLPNLADLIGFDIDWSKYEYIKRIYKDDDGREFDLSTYEPIDKGNYNAWCFTIKNGMFGNFDILKYNGLISNWAICGFFSKVYSCIESFSAYHKLYAFSHTNSKILNLTENHNGRKLLISCDSQMIPIIPFLATIFAEVWVLDNRVDTTIHPIIDDIEFDDVLIAAPMLPGSWPVPDLDRFTIENFK